MSCEACREAIEVDELSPDCEGERGCLIPALTDQGQRVMEIRSLLARLHNLVDSGSVLRLFGADLEDLHLLALVEDEVKRIEQEGEEDKHG